MNKNENDEKLWTVKEPSLNKIIDKLNPKTGLTIGDNAGRYSLFLASKGVSVISLDRNEESINQLYSYACSKNVDVLPLQIDIRQPTPEYELNIGTILAATNRFRSEFVIATLSISDDLLSGQRVMVGNQVVKLEHLIHWIDMFAEKHLLIEFITKDAQSIQPSISEEDKSVRVLKDAFGRFFKYDNESHTEENNLLLFRKENVE